MSRVYPVGRNLSLSAGTIDWLGAYQGCICRTRTSTWVFTISRSQVFSLVSVEPEILQMSNWRELLVSLKSHTFFSFQISDVKLAFLILILCSKVKWAQETNPKSNFIGRHSFYEEILYRLCELITHYI